MALVFMSCLLLLLPLSKLRLLSTMQRLVTVLQRGAQLLLSLPLLSLGRRCCACGCFACEWSIHSRCLSLL